MSNPEFCVGKVISISKESVKITIEKDSSCKGCGSASICNLIGSSAGKTETTVSAPYKDKVEIGETVKLKIETHGYNYYLALAFFVPSLFFIIGMFIGDLFVKNIKDSNYEVLIEICSGAIFALISYLLSKKITKRLVSKGSFYSVVDYFPINNNN